MPWSREENAVLGAVVLASATLSLAGSVSVLVVLARRDAPPTPLLVTGDQLAAGRSRRALELAAHLERERRRLPPYLTALGHLAASDCAVAVLLVAMACVALADLDSSGRFFGVCVYGLGLVVHVLYQTTFWLTFAFALQVLANIRGMPNTPAMFAVRLLSWTMPLLITTLAFVAHDGTIDGADRPENWCTEVTFGPNVLLKGASEALYVPLYTSMVLITVIYGVAIASFRRHLRQLSPTAAPEAASEVRRVMVSLVAFVAVFFLCWSANLVELIIFWVDPDKSGSQLFPLYVAQGILNPLQGALNALVYGWSNRSFVQFTRLRGPEQRVVAL